MPGKPISVSFVADTRDLKKSLTSTKADLTETGAEAAKTADKVEKVFLRVTDNAGAAATNFSILGGAVGDVAGGVETFGAKLGLSEGAIESITGGSEALSKALMFGAGVADIAAVSTELLNGATLKGTAIKIKDTVVTKAKVAGEVIASGAAKAMAVSQWALNAAMTANPIGLIVLGIAALVAGLVVAYQKSETFRNIVDGAFAAVKVAAAAVVGFFTTKIPAAFGKVREVAGNALGWVKKNWPLILGILTGPIGLAVVAVAKNWDKIKAGAGAAKDFVTEKFNKLLTFFTGLPSRMTRAVSGLFNGLKNAFTDAVNYVIDKWNGFSLSIKLPKVLGGGSIGIDTPNIPHLAKGGIVTGPTLALIGEGAHDEAVIPLDGRGFGGNTYRISVTAPIGSSALDIGRELVAYIDAYESEGGRRRAA